MTIKGEWQSCDLHRQLEAGLLQYLGNWAGSCGEQHFGLVLALELVLADVIREQDAALARRGHCARRWRSRQPPAKHPKRRHAHLHCIKGLGGLY